MHSHPSLLVLLSIYGIVLVYGKTGEEIADALYQHPNECKDPSDGGIWAPLQGENPDCGGKKCGYPKQWCSATSDPKISANKPNLNCVDLPPDCQKAVEGGGETTTGAPAETTAASTAAGESTTTSQQTTTASTPTTRAQSKATSKPSGASGASAAPGASTAAPGGGGAGCKDNNEFCCFWAAKQQCDANPGWMRTQCQSSCGTCGCEASKFQSCTVKVNTTGCKYLNGGAGGQGNKVRIQLGGGPGLAGMGFGNPGGQGGNGSSIVKIPLGGGPGIGGMRGMGGQGGNGSSIVKLPLSGGSAFPSSGTSGSSSGGNGASANGQKSNKIRVPVGGGGAGFGQSPVGAGAGGAQSPGGAASNPGNSGMPGGKPSSIVTIPVGRRKRRHFMPQWFN